MVLAMEIIIPACTTIVVTFVSGVFLVYSKKVEKRVKIVETKSKSNDVLTIENNILEQILPTLERKDEALDKIADVLENVLEIQRLQNQRISQVEDLLKLKCQAPELIEQFKNYLEVDKRKEVNEGLIRSLLEEK